MTIGGCRIEQLLGRNDISYNCLATQISMERPVVLKILSPAATSDRRCVERFNSAARAGGKLSHPNIVRIYDAGEEKGWHFIAMEYVGGKSVRQLLADQGRNRPLKVPQALEIAEQAAGALEYAHSVSVIHGHISHDTVLVTPHGIAKLAEVGFAPSAASFADPRPSPPEHPDEVQFTPPELFAGARALTPQCDIYSLGVVLFLMVTGRLPFHGAAGKELLERIRNGEHEPARRLRRDTPESVEQLLEHALAAAPAGRFRDAAELHAALLKEMASSE
jgi:serine/threonine-protein kinase